jgi:hypothetical protein
MFPGSQPLTKHLTGRLAKYVESRWPQGDTSRECNRATIAITQAPVWFPDRFSYSFPQGI